MLSLKINNNQIEQALLAKFKTISAIEDYFCKLVKEDAEDEAFAHILDSSNRGDFVSRDEVFNALNNAS